MHRLLIPALLTPLFVVLIACADDDGPAMTDAGMIMPPDLGAAPVCVNPATRGEALAPCVCGSDCVETALCDPEEFSSVPGGSCIQACAVDADCGAGARCEVDAIGRCVPTCTAASECGSGRVCFSGDCVALCQADVQCVSGNCDGSTGRCRAADFVPTGADTSEECLRDEDCKSDVCAASRRCLTLCSRSAQGCPDGEFCFGDDAYIDGGQCLPLCETTAECADPTAECADVTDLGRTARVCF